MIARQGAVGGTSTGPTAATGPTAGTGPTAKAGAALDRHSGHQGGKDNDGNNFAVDQAHKRMPIAVVNSGSLPKFKSPVAHESRTSKDVVRRVRF